MGAWYLTRAEIYHPYQDAGGKFNEKALDFGYIYDSSNKMVIMGRWFSRLAVKNLGHFTANGLFPSIEIKRDFLRLTFV